MKAYRHSLPSILFLSVLFWFSFSSTSWAASPGSADSSDFTVTAAQRTELLQLSTDRLNLLTANELSLTDSAKQIASLQKTIGESQQISQRQETLLVQSESQIKTLLSGTDKLLKANAEINSSFQTYKKQKEMEIRVYKVVGGAALVYIIVNTLSKK